MKWPFLSLVTIFALESVFSNVNIVTPAFFWLVLAWFIFFQSFFMILCVFIFKVDFFQPCFFIQSDNHFHLIWLLIWLGLNLISYCLFSVRYMCSCLFFIFFLFLFNLHWVLFYNCIYLFCQLISPSPSPPSSCFRVYSLHLKPVMVYLKVILGFHFICTIGNILPTILFLSLF